MTTIQTDKPVITLINVFTVDPANQQWLLDLLIEATEKVMKHLPGYVSANIHKSIDGTQVVNYAQWRSRETFIAGVQHREAQVHMRAAEQLASIKPILYTVVYTDEAT